MTLFPLRLGVLSDLVVCWQPQLLGADERVGPVIAEDGMAQQSSPASGSHKRPVSCSVRSDTSVPLRTEHFLVTSSLHVDQS